LLAIGNLIGEGLIVPDELLPLVGLDEVDLAMEVKENKEESSGEREEEEGDKEFPLQADVMDPAEVRRFAEELKRFNIEIQNRMALLQARFAALGDTWQDQEHQKFSEEFRDTMKVLKKFIESSNQHTPFLLRKAQRIEEYLDQH